MAQVKSTARFLKDPFAYTRIRALTSFTIKPVTLARTQLMENIAEGTCACNPGCNTLPVSLLAFDAKRTSHEKVLVKWETTNEINNKGFDVELSYGSTDKFKAVGFVAAKQAGGYKNKYDIIDQNDFSGTSYYRLKQIDMDRGFVYSNTVPVKGYTSKATLALYPNPAQYTLVANVYANEKATAKLFILDAMLKVVHTQAVNLQAGSNTLSLPIQKLAKGKLLCESSICAKQPCGALCQAISRRIK